MPDSREMGVSAWKWEIAEPSEGLLGIRELQFREHRIRLIPTLCSCFRVKARGFYEKKEERAIIWSKRTEVSCGCRNKLSCSGYVLRGCWFLSLESPCQSRDSVSVSLTSPIVVILPTPQVSAQLKQRQVRWFLSSGHSSSFWERLQSRQLFRELDEGSENPPDYMICFCNAEHNLQIK